MDEFRERVERVADDLDAADRKPAQQGGRIIGFSHEPGSPAPEGWKVHAKYNSVITPDRRTSGGKSAVKLLDPLKIPNLRDSLPGGMPGTVIDFDRAHFYDAGIRRMGDTVYVTYGTDRLPDEYVKHVDAAMWEVAPLSEYYAALERDEAAERAS
jgi:hypothetical protein